MRTYFKKKRKKEKKWLLPVYSSKMNRHHLHILYRAAVLLFLHTLSKCILICVWKVCSYAYNKQLGYVQFWQYHIANGYVMALVRYRTEQLALKWPVIKATAYVQQLYMVLLDPFMPNKKQKNEKKLMSFFVPPQKGIRARKKEEEEIMNKYRWEPIYLKRIDLSSGFSSGNCSWVETVLMGRFSLRGERENKLNRWSAIIWADDEPSLYYSCSVHMKQVIWVERWENAFISPKWEENKSMFFFFF